MPHGISCLTFYKCRSKYGGLEVSGAKRLRSLEIENRKLKQLLADTILEILQENDPGRKVNAGKSSGENSQK